jgi:hypothetical protein
VPYQRWCYFCHHKSRQLSLWFCTYVLNSEYHQRWFQMFHPCLSVRLIIKSSYISRDERIESRFLLVLLIFCRCVSSGSNRSCFGQVRRQFFTNKWSKNIIFNSFTFRSCTTYFPSNTRETTFDEHSLKRNDRPCLT